MHVDEKGHKMNGKRHLESRKVKTQEKKLKNIDVWWSEETETRCRTISSGLIRLDAEILQMNEKDKERSFERCLFHIQIENQNSSKFTLCLCAVEENVCLPSKVCCSYGK